MSEVLGMLQRLVSGFRRPSSDPPPDLVAREREAERCHREAFRQMQENRLAWDVRPDAREKAPTLRYDASLESRLDREDQLVKDALGG